MKVLVIGTNEILETDSKILTQTCLLPCDGYNPTPQKYMFQSRMRVALLKSSMDSLTEEVIRTFKVGDFPKGEVFADMATGYSCEHIPFVIANPLIEEYVCNMEKRIEELNLQVSTQSLTIHQLKTSTVKPSNKEDTPDAKPKERRHFLSIFKRRK